MYHRAVKYGLKFDVLQVGIGRLLQEEEHSGKAAVDCSTHERGDAEVVRTLGQCSRLVRQQLHHHLHVAVGCGCVQQGEG